MVDPAYRRRVRAWVTYDWANSAFATTILAAVLPVYYSSVAGATLPSAATATQYYSLTLSASVLVVAVLSPVLGGIADVAGTRKRFLLGFAAVGIVATAGLVGVGVGDWLLASVLFGIGRIGFGGSLVFYDALLPHVARPADLDRISARGYAWGYLGGGILLAANAVAILLLPEDDLGFRLSLLSVAVWWAVFTTPLVRHVPEPPGEGVRRAGSAVAAGFRDTVRTLRSLGRFPDLRRFLFAFLIYNDAINVVIATAAIYGVELGFDPIQLTLAILLVQFVGGPYAMVFGALPDPTVPRRRRRVLTAFVVANIVLLPVTGIGLRLLGPADVTGTPGPPIAAAGSMPDVVADGGDAVLRWTGQSVELTYTAGPDRGELPLRLDGAPLVDGGDPVVLDAEGPAVHAGEVEAVEVADIGAHELVVVGGAEVVTAAEVLPAERSADLAVILGALVAVQLVAGALAVTVLGRLCARLADRMTTRSAILLSLWAYVVVAVWGFALDSVAEFWALAWLVAVSQGGSQALSRSLYARLIPDRRSGEFFGFFSILSKFASFLSPLVFAASVALFASSRPAVLVIGGFFVVGMVLLRGVDTARGEAVAATADRRMSHPRA